MPSIDERVVAMAFENAKFEAAIAQTMRTLDKLNQSLAQVGANSGFDKIEGAAKKVTLNGPMSALDKLKQKLGMAANTKPITDIEAAANKVSLLNPMSALDKLKQKMGSLGGAKEITDIEGASDRVTMSGLGNAVDGIRVKFGALQTVALGALANIGAQASAKGTAMLKSLTIGPITQGLEEYGTTLTSVQTILANTQDSGGNLKSVNAALLELNQYSDKTIYNFSEMAKNIGTFTAAGVDLKTATGSIKGIANLAALSGSSSQQASTAMYQLSQAIAAGRVSLQDWNSVVNAGMGGAVFQKALARSAVAMGTLNKDAVKVDKTTGKLTINGESFRESITARPGQKSWLSSEVLTGSLKQFTGDMTDAELAAQGFDKAQTAAIQKQAKMAQKAATESKTLKQVFDVTKEAIGSGWAQTWQLIFGDFKEAKTLFTGMATAISNIVGNAAKARNKILGDWKKLGGRNLLIESLKTGLKALGQILGTVKGAFRDIFPRKSGKDLFELTKRFSEFTKTLKASPQTLDNLRATFRGLFAVLDIGWQIVKKVVGVIFDLLGVAKGGAGGFLAFTGGIGNFLTAIDNAIKKGHALDSFFNGLTAVLQVPLHILGAIAKAFFGLFGGLDSGKADAAAKSIDHVRISISPLEKILIRVKEAWKHMVDFFGQLKEKVGPAIHHALEPIIHIGDTIVNAFKGIDSSKAASILQTALLGGIFVTLKKALTGGVSVTIGKLDGLNKVMGALTGNLKAMQRSIQAAVLLEIATAILALAAGVALLSSIDPKALDRAMSAVAIGLGQLVGALFLLSKATSGAGFATMPLLAASLIALATAVTILAVAMKIFATMSWEDLAKGLIGVGGALLAVGVGMQAIGAIRLTTMAPGLIVVALAMNLLAVAMKQFGSLSWEEIEKGLIGMGASLLAVGFALQSFGPQTLLIAPGLVIVAIAMSMLAGAVGAFGSLEWDTLGKGLAGLTAALLLIGAALWEMPPGPLLAGQAAGLVILAVALTGIAAAVKVMGGMSVVEIAKGLVALGGALFILAVGLDLMTATAPGAVALIAAAAGLALLAPTLAFMGTLKWGTIFKGLVAIAASLLVLSAVGAVASTGLLALGIALAALAAAVLIAGTGMFLIGKGLSSISDSGSRAIAVMIAAMTAFILAIPGLIISFIKGLVEAIGALAKILPSIVDSLVKILNTVVDVIIKTMPKIQEALESIITAFINVVNNKSGPLIAAGWKLLLNFLSGISNHIGDVANHAASIVINFLNTLASRAPAITAAGARFIIAFLTGVGNHIASVVATGGRIIAKFLEGIARAIPGIVGGVAHIIIAFIRAVGGKIPAIVRSGVYLATKFIKAVANAMVKLADVGAKAIIRFMNALAVQIEKHVEDFVKAGFRIGAAVVKGFAKGIEDVRQQASDALNEAVFHNEKRSRKGVLANVQEGKRHGVKRSDLEGNIPEDILDQVYGKKPRKKEAAHKQGVDTGDKFSQGIKSTMDITPKITPVLDLSTVKKQSGELSALTQPKAVAHVSRAQALAAFRETEARRRAVHSEPKQPAVKEVKFTQNNYSPEALPASEIYRRTKTQLGAAKVRLGVADR